MAENVASKLWFAAAESVIPGTGYQVCRAHELPEETEAISQKTLGSRPSRSASTEPSEHASRQMNSIMLFTIFAACPVPAAPVWTTRPAMGCTISSARRACCSSPPIMNVRVPAAAPLIPPDTGASTNAKPASAAARCSSSAVATSMVELSTRSASFGARASTPSSPRYTARECSPLGSMVMTTSAPSSASFMVRNVCTPPSRAAAIAASLRSKPRTSWPAATRLADIGAPMWPRPIQVMVLMWCVLSWCWSGTGAALGVQAASVLGVDLVQGHTLGLAQREHGEQGDEARDGDVDGDGDP